jgi:hypothetical protein
VLLCYRSPHAHDLCSLLERSPLGSIRAAASRGALSTSSSLGQTWTHMHVCILAQHPVVPGRVVCHVDTGMFPSFSYTKLQGHNTLDTTLWNLDCGPSAGQCFSLLDHAPLGH